MSIYPYVEDDGVIVFRDGALYPDGTFVPIDPPGA